MNLLREYGIAEQAFGEVAASFDSMHPVEEVENGYNYRWARDAIQAGLNRIYQESYLAGQVLEVTVDYGAARWGEAVTLSDDYGNSIPLHEPPLGAGEMPVGQETFIGRLCGLEISAEYACEIDVPWLREHSTRQAWVRSYMTAERRLRENIMEGPHLSDSWPLRANFNLLLRPSRVPFGYSVDPETAYYHIPRQLCDAVSFPDASHPFQVVQTALNVLYELGRNGDAQLKRDIASQVPGLLVDLFELSEVANRRVRMWVADGVEHAFRVGDVLGNEILTTPAIREVSGWFMGLTVKMDELEGDSAPNIIVAVAQSETNEEEIKLVPVKSLAEASVEYTSLSDVDQGVMRLVAQCFADVMDEVVWQDAFDHQAIEDRASKYIAKLNGNAVIDLDYAVDEHELIIQLERDEYFGLVKVTPGMRIHEPGALERIGELSGDLAIGEHCSVPCRLLGYVLDTRIAREQDQTLPAESEDYQLMAVIQPNPDSIFDRILPAKKANALIVPVNGIINSRFPHAGMQNTRVKN